jgi:hypothetical protein
MKRNNDEHKPNEPIIISHIGILFSISHLFRVMLPGISKQTS